MAAHLLKGKILHILYLGLEASVDNQLYSLWSSIPLPREFPSLLFLQDLFKYAADPDLSYFRSPTLRIP